MGDVPQPFRIKPAPTEEEAAVIAAALELIAPLLMPAAVPADQRNDTRWRFSGRSWASTDRWSGWLHR